jgi:hypothetical protein
LLRERGRHDDYHDRYAECETSHLLLLDPDSPGFQGSGPACIKLN